MNKAVSIPLGIIVVIVLICGLSTIISGLSTIISQNYIDNLLDDYEKIIVELESIHEGDDAYVAKLMIQIPELSRITIDISEVFYCPSSESEATNEQRNRYHKLRKRFEKW